MPSYAILLRGINLGRRRLPMRDLKAIFERAGFTNVETLLASGNVVAETDLKSTADVEAYVEDFLAQSLQYPVDTFVRTVKEIRCVATKQPFSPIPQQVGSTLHIQFLKKPLPRKLATQISGAQTDEDRIHIEGREIYWLRTGRLSDSVFWESSDMRSLRLPTRTQRTASTVRKIASRLSET